MKRWLTAVHAGALLARCHTQPQSRQEGESGISAPNHRRDWRRGRHFGKILAGLALALTAAAIMSSAASAATACMQQPLRTGSRGECVKDLQVALDGLWGLSHGSDPSKLYASFGPDRLLTADGIYGTNTYLDVKATNNVCWHRDGECNGGSGYANFSTWNYVCQNTYFIDHYYPQGCIWYR